MVAFLLPIIPATVESMEETVDDGESRIAS
jgi:hypothetical protein